MSYLRYLCFFAYSGVLWFCLSWPCDIHSDFNIHTVSLCFVKFRIDVEQRYTSAH
jgi:hypothetical protein